jgi:hypothetical protein
MHLPFVAGTEQPERVLVVAGHSVFMNGMMAQADNDNFAFAWNCIDWLSESKKRKHALFVEEGKVMTKFDVALALPTPVPIPPVAVVNHLLYGLEQEDFFNRLLHRLVSPQQVWRIVLLVFSGFLVLWGSWRLVRGRYRTEAAVPLLVPEPASVPAVELTLSAERQQAHLKGNDYREAAQALARYFFEEFTAPSASGGLRDPRRRDMPSFAIHASWWQRSAIQKQLRYLWLLAYGDPGPVSAKQFQMLPGLLDQLAPAVRKRDR